MSVFLRRWLNQVKEDAIEEDLPIVDPHHHLWDPTREPRGDLTLAGSLVKYMKFQAVRNAFIRAALPSAGVDAFGVRSTVVDKFMVEELMASFDGHNVIQTVAIQAQWKDKKPKSKELECLGETKKFLTLQDTHGYPTACSGHIDLRVGKEKVKAAAIKHLEVNHNLRGFRHQISWHSSSKIFNSRDAEKDMIKNPNFLGGLAALEELGLLFEMWCFHTQLGDVADAIEKFPKLQFVLDHVGTPLGFGPYEGIQGRAKARAEWEEGIKKVASKPNVVCKLSGLTMPMCGFGFDRRAKPPTSDELLEVVFPYYKFCIDTFGVDRCMFASNFPVDAVSCSYVVLFNTFKKICNKMGLDEESKSKLFRKNAQRVYKLPEVTTKPGVSSE